MSQNSNTKFSSDSNILYRLNTECGSCQINEIDRLLFYSENDEDFNIHGQMESASKEETSDIDSDNIDTNLVAGNHQNIQW
ncbi:unnamed protein product [Rotaria socialis]|uniref:Uncharacterized protein n=1 Tax=Rotaria socialis TaxID=392032 RepID=A0A821AAY4_9BILA|nr:unnamed protein product [Rotaria socialis]